MKQAYIQTTRSTAIIDGDTLVIDMADNRMLFVYAGERLTGVFLMSEVIDAHLTERRKDGQCVDGRA